MFNATKIFIFLIVYIHMCVTQSLKLACRLRQITNSNDSVDVPTYDRIIAIGDVHGSHDGLIEILSHAGLLLGDGSCKWKTSVTSTLVIQMGDIVDRGIYSASISVQMCS
jgi:hypothetical protein